MQKEELINEIDRAIHAIKQLPKGSIDSFYKGIKIFKAVCSGISGQPEYTIVTKVQQLQKEIYAHEPREIAEFREAALLNTYMWLPHFTFDTVAEVYSRNR